MNYIIAIICAIVVTLIFGLLIPTEQLYLTWFIYLIVYFGYLIVTILEDIRDGICK